MPLTLMYTFQFLTNLSSGRIQSIRYIINSKSCVAGKLTHNSSNLPYLHEQDISQSILFKFTHLKTNELYFFTIKIIKYYCF